MFLSKISIQRPVFATMINLVLIVFGLFAYQRIGIDQYPNVDFPFVTVQVIYPGADPKSVEQKILDPLEKGLNGLAGLEKITSTAYPNVGFVILQFKLERDGNQAAQEVRDKVSTLQSQLPAEARTPTISKVDVGAAPIFNLAVSSNSIPYAQLSKLAVDKIKPALEQVPGVGSVMTVGDRQREVHVYLDPYRLSSFGLSPTQVSAAIQTQNMDIPGGKIENSSQLIRIRTEGTLRSAEEISKITIPLRSGQKLRVEDVAQVVDTLAVEETYSHFNGRNAITLTLFKQSGGNTVAVANNARNKISELKSLLPQGVQLDVVTDNSIYIKGSIDSVKFDLLLGALLAVLIVLFFLHDWRATIISAVALPTSVIATFAFVQYMGFTLNMMTTLALTLSIGILVDDAIVVIENIYRLIETGEKPVDAANHGTAEIGLAVIAITLSIISVFVPVAFMDGILGRFFYQFGMTVAFAVVVSLFVAFTLTPMLSSRMLKVQHKKKHFIFNSIEVFLQKTENQYGRILKWSLHHRAVTVGAGVCVLILSGFLLQFVPKGFFPNEDKGEFSVQYKLAEGSPLSLMKVQSQILEQILQSYPGVVYVANSIGANMEKSPNLARLDVRLVEKSKRNFSQDDLINRLRGDLKPQFEKDGATVEVIVQSGGAGGKSQPIQLILSSKDNDKLIATAAKIKEYVETQVPGAVDISTTEPPLVKEYKIVVDPVLATDLGINVAQIGVTLKNLFDSNKIGEIEDKGERFDVVMRLAQSNTKSKQDLAGIVIPNNQGQNIALSSVAKIIEAQSPARYERLRAQRQIMILSNFKGADLAAAIAQIEKYARSVVPDGVNLEFEGQAKLYQDAVKSILSALLLAVLLVFMVLCAQFESYLTPFVIMMSVPLAFSGAFLGLLITQKTMSIYSMIGLIMLMGLVTKNAILLIDFTLTRIRDGKSVYEALMEAGAMRLRPILMTTLAMVFGMLPIALGHGVGGEARSPMAVCVIGGLLSSTLLTLIVVPCVFSLVQGGKIRVGKFFKRSPSLNKT